MKPSKYTYITKTELRIFRVVYYLWFTNRKSEININWRIIHYKIGSGKWFINRTMQKLESCDYLKRRFLTYARGKNKGKKCMFQEGTFIIITQHGQDFWKYTNHHNLVRQSKQSKLLNQIIDNNKDIK